MFKSIPPADSRPGGEHWRLSPPQSVWATVKRYARLVAIPATPHMFRHAMAGAMLNKGAPISLIEDCSLTRRRL